MTRAGIQSILRTSWWVLFPAFGTLVVRLSIERICGDPNDLLPALTSSPAASWVLAGVYLMAHVWIISAYLISVERDGLLSGLTNIGRTGPPGRAKIYAMIAVFLIEYSPITFWRFAGTVTGCDK